MKAPFSFPCLFIISLAITFSVNAQKTGIGTTNPRQILHISAATDSALLVLDNRTALNTGTSSSLYFRNGTWFTGAIKTVGQGTNEARLTFYTFAAGDSSKLRERMTIRDNGFVGIGTSTPSEMLDVEGRGQFTTSNSLTAAVTGINSGNTNYNYAGVRGIADLMGVAGQATDPLGIGVQGINLNGSAAGASYPAGVGVAGYSNANFGVFGATGKSGAAGVYGQARVNGGIGGWFDANIADNYTGTLALRTIGPVRMTALGEGAGKVLTSDATGNASWQSLPQAGSGFSAYLTANTVINNADAYPVLTGFTEEFDEGNSFNNGTFTAPAAGLYYFTFKLSLIVPNTATTATDVFISISQSVAFNTGSILSNRIEPTGGNTFSQSVFLSRLVKLSQGETVSFRLQVTRTGAANHTVVGANTGVTTTVSGYRVN